MLNSVCLRRRTFHASFFSIALILFVARTSQATILVASNNNAVSLANAATAFGGPGIVVTNATLSGQSLGLASSTGIYSADGATYGLTGIGVVLSSGDALGYGSGPNITTQATTAYDVAASVAQNTLLSPISNQLQHFDVTELLITFNTLPGFDRVYVDVAFGSDEFPEFVSSNLIDPFGLFVNGTNIAFSGGFPVNSSHPSFAAIAGTELDGVLAPGGLPLTTYSAFVGSGTTGNTIRFILADAVDSVVDSTAYVSSLGGSPGGIVPEPVSLATWAFGIVAFVCFDRRKRPIIMGCCG